jgi:hypothetical protein
MALSNAERQKEYRERRKAEGMKRDWIRKNGLVTASDIARERFEKYAAKKIRDNDGLRESDLTVWEFYTFLLAQAKRHKLDFSGFASVEYQADQATAKKRRNRESGV